MKRKNIISIMLLSISLLLVGCKKNPSPSSSQEPPVSESSSEEDTSSKITEGTLKQRLLATNRVSNIHSLGESKKFKILYYFDFTQYIDHENKALGTFTQRVEIGFNGYDLPNVFVTSGYSIMDNNSIYTTNENELAFLLGCNYVFVEHRYFNNSWPVKVDYTNKDMWKYLTTKQSADDHHDIVTQMKRILNGKWVSTGMSKGGMTTELFAYYHPGDMDLYLPYVAPFCNSIADTRMFKFIYEEAGDIQYGEEKAAKLRKEMLDFQVKLLEYRDTLAERFYQAGVSSLVTYSEKATKDLIYDAAVIEFGIGLWQYNQDFASIEKCLNMSEGSSKIDSCYRTFTSVVAPGDLEVNGEYTSYYIQAYQELGNYGYDFSYIRNALTDKTLLTVTEEEERSLMFDLTLTDEERKLEKKDLMYTKINNMLKTTNDNFIIIYGSSDPWYSVRPDDVLDRDNISIYVNPKYPHGSNISNFDKGVRNEILGKIKAILEIQ